MNILQKIFSFSFFLLVFFSCKENTSSSNDSSSTKTVKEFNYVPLEPENGKLYGVVELGAAGFNSFIVEVDENSNWKVNHREYGTSLLVEGMTNTMLVNQKLKEYLEKLIDLGLDSENIHFVVSSGAAKENITKVIAKELENLEHTVNIVTPKEEAEYGLISMLPENYKLNSFAVDIGSGNTKISYLDTVTKEKIISFDTHGAKYYQKGTEDVLVYNEVKEIASKIPNTNKEFCFIMGGVPNQMVNTIYKNVKKYTVLSANCKEYSDVKGKKISSGINIFKAINEGAKANQYIYSDDGNFAIGYLLKKITKKSK